MSVPLRDTLFVAQSEEVRTSEQGDPISLDRAGEATFVYDIELGAIRNANVTRDLEQAEQRFQAILEASPTPLLLSRLDDGQILYANDRVEELLRVEAGALVGRRTVEFYCDPAERARVVELIQQHGSVRDLELQIRQKDGAIRWVLASVQRFIFEGEPALATSLLDITERKKSDELLRDREEYFRSLIENASDIIAVVDMQGNLTYASPATERILGYRVDDRVGRPSDELLHEEDAAALRQIYHKVYRNPNESHQFEFRFRHRDGSLRDLEGIVKAIQCDGGACSGIIINARDVTRRKENEKLLRFQKTLLETQSDSLMDGMLVVSSDRRILSFNQRFCDMFGFPPDVLKTGSDEAALASAIGKIQNPEAFLERIAYLYSNPYESARDEVVLRDGRILDRHSAPLVSKEGHHYGRLWFFRDVTAEKTHANELMAARIEADAARERASRYAKSLRKELEIGRQIQRGFLPSELPQPDGWEADVRFRPAWQVAGDFYDMFYVRPGLLGIVVADVCGKGVGAALFMALFQSLLRTSAERVGSAPPECSNPEAAIAVESLTSTNDYIRRVHRPSHIFASVFFGLLDEKTGHVTYVNAGHEPPLVIDRRRVRRLKPTGPAVGLLAGATFDVQRIRMRPGDLLLAYTDGVTETRNASGDFFGEQRLAALLASPASASPAEALERVERAVTEFAGASPPSDDVTLLAVRRLPLSMPAD